MYNTYYTPQANIDRINNQIAELERMKSQIPNLQQPTPTNLTQNFQLTPQYNQMRYVNSLEDVKKEVVVVDTPFFSRDLSVLWLKNSKGDIRGFELNEIIPKDNKDMQIEFLQSQIEELRKEIKRNESINANANESVEDEKPTSVSAIPKSSKKSK